MNTRLLKSTIITTFTTLAILTGSVQASESSSFQNIQTMNILYVNINTDDIETLTDLLNGVGTKKAQAIIDYRELNGPFNSAEELLNVKGIGEKILERNIKAIVIDQNIEISER